MDSDRPLNVRSRRASIFSFEPHHKDGGKSSMYQILESHPSQIPNRPPKALYENTYKMEPDRRFDVKEAKDAVDAILEETFADIEYDPTKMPQLAKEGSMLIKDKLKYLGYERFKFVCNVTIGQQGSQAIRISSRFIWDEKTDNWINSVYSNKEIFVAASVFALYYE